MAYTVSEKVFIGGLGLLFCLISISTLALILTASYWLQNRKDARSRAHKKEEARIIQRADAERMEWSQLLTERDSQINKLLDQVATLTTALDRTKRLLEVSEAQRMKL